MLYTLLALLLELALHLSFCIALLRRTVLNRVKCYLQFLAYLRKLAFCRSSLRFGVSKPLLGTHSSLLDVLCFPVSLPVDKRRDELRFCKAARCRLEHTLLVHVVLVHFKPCRPPTSQTLLHEAAHAKLLQVSDALLALAFELFLHEPFPFSLCSTTFEHRFPCC